MKETLPIPGSLIHDDHLTYAWTEKETALGPVRIDFLMRNIRNVVDMKQFLFELDGRPIGRIGDHKAKDSDCLCTNWYCGLQHGDHAFKIVDSLDYKKKAFTEARLEIWYREGSGKPGRSVGC